MGPVLYFLVPFAIAAVAVVLGFGLVNMMRGGSPQRSQKLMQLHVLAQAIARLIIMGAIYFLGK